MGHLPTPEDIRSFHQMYSNLCSKHLQEHPSFSYASMKQACDDYFFLPARQEHRGTGGIFFDDLPVDEDSMEFVKGVVTTWMPSWLPIAALHRADSFTDDQKQWQLLRRGRYLEFNLLYDRGVKFGLANANPRVEGVMVSAPPMIAFEYNHKVEENSAEAALLKVLKEPKDWAWSSWSASLALRVQKSPAANRPWDFFKRGESDWTRTRMVLFRVWFGDVTGNSLVTSGNSLVTVWYLGNFGQFWRPTMSLHMQLRYASLCFAMLRCHFEIPRFCTACSTRRKWIWRRIQSSSTISMQMSNRSMMQRVKVTGK